jgi:hypothetical protein
MKRAPLSVRTLLVACLACLPGDARPQSAAPSREYIYAGERLLAVVGPAQLSIADIAVMEGQSGTRSATFTVMLSEPRPHPVTVGYATANGTALAGSDYAAASGVLTFPADTTSRTVDVAVIGDTASEPRETFFVNLSGAAGAAIGDPQGQATIVDDEASGYFPLDPCRVADTRTSPPPLAGGTSRNFPVGGVCGVPLNARAVALVVTTTGQTGLGNLRIYPAPGPPPLANVINFSAAKARASNTIVPLGQDGQVGVHCDMAAGHTHVILDVMGYFQ